MTACVLDASFTMQWMFEDEASAAGYAALNVLATTGATVPALWLVEVTNALGMAERRGRLSASEFVAGLRLLKTIPLDMDEPPSLAWTGPVLALMRQHRLTAYDATYLELASRRRLPLATRDRELLVAARAVGVPLFA